MRSKGEGNRVGGVLDVAIGGLSSTPIRRSHKQVVVNAGGARNWTGPVGVEHNIHAQISTAGITTTQAVRAQFAGAVRDVNSSDPITNLSRNIFLPAAEAMVTAFQYDGTNFRESFCEILNHYFRSYGLQWIASSDVGQSRSVHEIIGRMCMVKQSERFATNDRIQGGGGYWIFVILAIHSNSVLVRRQ